MTLSELNVLPLDDVRSRLLECCGSADWAHEVLARRPFESSTKLFDAAEKIWWQLSPPSWLEAFSKHPRIGARDPVSAWSSEEQAGVKQAGPLVAEAMQNLNRQYVEKFGWIFIVCAAGKSADEMRVILADRLGNAPSDELRTAAAEQSKIMVLRLRKLLTV